MSRKLFCEISPLTYKISVHKCRFLRHIENIFSKEKFAKERQAAPLPVLVYKQNSLMRRKLGNVDLSLQENKVINLSIAAPKITGILIKPGETFSFWKLAGSVTEKKGYKTGLVIAKGKPSQDIGGGMCQFTNLIHWMVLHTPLDIVEYHHHDGVDLFPDFGRQIPFGTGTSILYNYLDYRFKNNTSQTFQLIVYTDAKYLCGEIRSTEKLPFTYHVKAEGEKFVRLGNDVYRESKVFREKIDVVTGNIIKKELIKENHAKLMYEISEDKISKS